MIISDIRFGLGNQMFQYAIGKSLSLRVDTDFRICIDSINPDSAIEYRFHLEKFKTEVPIISYKEAVKQINNTKFHKLLSRIFPTYRKMYFDQMQGFDQKFLSLRSKDIFISGCFQSYKYFEDIRLELLADFTPLNQPIPTELVEKIKKNNTVSLHIRRGDYLSNRNLALFHQLNYDNYYKKAIQTIKTKIGSIDCIYIFGDDINWLKNSFAPLINEEFQIIEPHPTDPVNDMMLMSNCTHNIIANSTFSYWAAYLNKNPHKCVVAPRYWTKNESTIDLIPSNWITIDNL